MDESAAVRAIGDLDPVPPVVDEVDDDAIERRITFDEMTAQQLTEYLRLAEALACGQRVDGILHRVGRQHVGVVTGNVGCVVLPSNATATVKSRNS